MVKLPEIRHKGWGMEIKRDRYLEQLKLRQRNGMIKIVTGVRRCGKSYLLFKLFLEHLLESGVPRDHIIDIALDDIANDALRDPHVLYGHVRGRIVDGQPYTILLDEIQFVDRFADVLNGFSHIDNADIYVTGSNSRFLSSDILTEFRGRGDEVRVWPLSFAEYLSACQDGPEDAFLDYMTYGGLPRILSMKTDAQKIHYLENLFRETYLKDIIDHNRIRNTAELESLVNVLASAVGSLTNPTKLADTFKSRLKSDISDKTIKRYMDYLQDAFLIDCALRYDIKGRKYIGTPKKIYFVDTGLRNARLGFRQVEETHLMENIIYNELRARGYAVDVGIVEIRQPDSEGSSKRVQLEVDFIATLGAKRCYIQSAFAIPDAAKKQQEERGLLKIGDSFKKVVVVGNHIKRRQDDNGIITMGIRDFLLDENSV